MTYKNIDKQLQPCNYYIQYTLSSVNMHAY